MSEPDGSAPTGVDTRAVGRRIAQARHESGRMSQQTLAELLCVCRRSVQSYEAGKRVPYRHLHRLEEIFERPPSWFLYGEGEETAPREAEPDTELTDRLELQTRALAALAGEVKAMRAALEAVASDETRAGRHKV
jgi:predicted transcriptional regulator